MGHGAYVGREGQKSRTFLFGKLRVRITILCSYRPTTITVKVPGRMVGRGRGLGGGGAGAGAEFSGDQVDAVGSGVIGHGAGAALGGQVLDSGVAGGVGIDYGEDSLAAGGEGELAGRVPAGCVGAVADGGSGEDFAGVGVDHGHVLAAADGEEAAAGDIEGQAAGSVPAGERPLGGELVGFGVQAVDLIFVFDVHEDRALAIDGGELGLAGERDGDDDRTTGGAD